MGRRGRLARTAAFAAAVLAVLSLAAWWPHARNEFFVLLGSRNESGGWYGFHSGMGGAAYITVVPAVAVLYWHRTCHRQWCPRLAHYDFTDESSGLTYRLCARDHPQHPGRKLTRRHIARIDERNRQ